MSADAWRAACERLSRDLAALEQLLLAGRFAPWVARDAAVDDLRLAAQRLAARFTLAVVGEFSSGKSFLLNALLGTVALETTAGEPKLTGLLATDINPSTATITELEYSDDPAAHAYYADGREERVPLGRLARFVAVSESAGKLHDATADERGAPVRVLVRTPSPFLREGYVVADTPGLASLNPAHRRATLSYLPRTDAVLYLIDTLQPFGDGDAAFLALIAQDVRSIFIVQTKIDLWSMVEPDGRKAWEAAFDRIRKRAADIAPQAAVVAISARDYALGSVTNDPRLIEQSRFGELQAALQASLAERTGRARVEQTAARAASVAAGACTFLAREIAALELDEAVRGAEYSTRESEIAAREAALAALAEQLTAAAHRKYALVNDRIAELAGDVERRLALAFDASDVAKLRDRAKLHVLVDTTVSAAVIQAADPLMSETAAELAQFAAQTGDETAIGRVAECFERTNLVFGVLAGPATTIVGMVGERFGAVRSGEYMKRELTADLRNEIFPEFAREFDAFAQDYAAGVAACFIELADAAATSRRNVRAELLGPLERAANVPEPAPLLRELRELEQQLGRLRSSIEEQDVPRAARAGARRANGTTGTPASIPFDADAYVRGLRPERYRISVFGGFNRGKSSLINAIAAERLLADTGEHEASFPIHVRWGPSHQAYSLHTDGTWREIEREKAIEAATSAAVLIEVPWELPRELVLVHAPSFDSGLAQAEEMCITAARASSEVLCLFSRQLSDRELDIFERIAQLRKPMLFAHTFADNEQAAERRAVVELADRYLKDRSIETARIFTISTRDFEEARAAGRAAAPWNEFSALVETIRSHGETHLARLTALEREQAKLRARPAADQRRGLFGTFERLLRGK